MTGLPGYAKMKELARVVAKEANENLQVLWHCEKQPDPHAESVQDPRAN